MSAERRPDSNAVDLFWMLARTEFRLRDQGTFLGFLWSLALPAFQFGILYAIFTGWMGDRVDNYAAYLLVGIVQWNLFAGGTAHGLTSLRRKAGLVCNFDFPRLFVPASSSAAVLASHAFEWIVLLAALAFLGVAPRWSWLLLPIPVAFAFLLTFGAACGLAFAAVRVRDLDHAWGVLLYGLFFATPIFYVPEVVGGAGRALLAWNPLGILIDASRSLVMGTPPPAQGSLVYAGFAAAASAAAGVAVSLKAGAGAAEAL